MHGRWKLTRYLRRYPGRKIADLRCDGTVTSRSTVMLEQHAASNLQVWILAPEQLPPWLSLPGTRPVPMLLDGVALVMKVCQWSTAFILIGWHWAITQSVCCFMVLVSPATVAEPTVDTCGTDGVVANRHSCELYYVLTTHRKWAIWSGSPLSKMRLRLSKKEVTYY